MDDRAGVAVPVAHVVVHHEISDDLVHVHHVLQVLTGVELFQRLDQAGLVRLGDVRFGIAEDVGIAVRVVVDIPELHVRRPHAAENAAEVEAAPSSAAAGFTLRLPAVRTGPGRVCSFGRPAAGLRGIKALRRLFAGLSGAEAFRRLAGETGAFGYLAVPKLRRIKALRKLSASEAGVGRIPFLRIPVHEVLHIEILAVARAAAAEAHAVRLIQLARVSAVVSLEEAVFYALHGEVQSPVLPVHRDIGEGTQRRVRAEFAHQTVCEIILHTGIVLDEIVQAELIQSVIVLPVLVLVELDLEAVPLRAHRLHR